MDYLSCFSGIGGLEASTAPILLCESNADATQVLRQLYPAVEIWPDIRTLKPPRVDVVAGGWPCQDISIAGRQAGLAGLQSRLLLDMLRVALQAKAHTVVAENVTNLLRLRAGAEFAASLHAFHAHGYESVAWRIVNAREFGLPQNRSRLLLIASSSPAIAFGLFRRLPSLPKDAVSENMRAKAAGFYWTAGTHSINYSHGYVPTIKVGSAVGIASPPAVHYDDVVRPVSAGEALALQGFKLDAAQFPSTASAYKAAGNAVARPIGRWVLDGVAASSTADPTWLPKQEEFWSDSPGRRTYPRAGISINGTVTGVDTGSHHRATNLYDYLDRASSARLSARACRGLLNRLTRSGQPYPDSLRELLVAHAA